MNVRYTDRAKDDVEMAFAWYEKQQNGLGLEFLASVELSLKKIQGDPEMYQRIYAGFRRCVVRRFPFSIFYTVEAEGVVIHSVFDNRQNPGKRP